MENGIDSFLEKNRILDFCEIKNKSYECVTSKCF